MSYASKIIAGDEKLVSLSRLHWIYLVQAGLWAGLFWAIGLYIDDLLRGRLKAHAPDFEYMLWGFEISHQTMPLEWLFLVAGIFVAMPLIITYIATEVALTDRRLIYKRGLILVQVQQVDLEDIRAENVNHGWFGWLLGYGRIHFDCRFVDDVFLPAIINPYRLVKAAHVARMKHPDIEYGEEELKLDIDHVERRQRKAARLKYDFYKINRNQQSSANVQKGGQK